MAELIHEHSTRAKGADGTMYRVRIYGQERTDGTWRAGSSFIRPTSAKRCCARNKRHHNPIAPLLSIGRRV